MTELENGGRFPLERGPFLLVASGTSFKVRTEGGRVLINWASLPGVDYAIPEGKALTIEVWPS